MQVHDGREKGVRIDKQLVDANVKLVDENKELKRIIEKIQLVVENERASGIEAKMMIKDILEEIHIWYLLDSE